MITEPNRGRSARRLTFVERQPIAGPFLLPLTRRPADPPAFTFDFSARRPADPPIRRSASPASHLSPLDLSPRRPADTPIRRPVSPARRHADPPIRRPVSPARRPADPPFRRPVSPARHPPIRVLSAVRFAGPSVFVSPNGARRSLITLTGASLKWPL